jgi:hypothetical protein
MVHLKGILLCALAAVQTVLAKGPFFQEINATTHVIGNDIWNITIGRQYGVKLFYKNKDIVGPAVGHYVSYSMFLLQTQFAILTANVQMVLHQTSAGQAPPSTPKHPSSST